MPKVTEAPHRLPTQDNRLRFTDEIKQSERAVPYRVQAYGDRRTPEPPAGSMRPAYPSSSVKATHLGADAEIAEPATPGRAPIPPR